MNKGEYLDSVQWTSVVNTLEKSYWTIDRKIDIEPIFSIISTPPFPWKRFSRAEEAIASLHGIRVDHKLIPNDGIVFDSVKKHSGYFYDCWMEQRGQMILPLGSQGIEGIYIDDKGFIYKNFENEITTMGRDLQEGLYNLMFGWGREEFRIECDEPDEIFNLYSQGLL